MKKLFENFKKRDLIVILISIAALVLLFFAIRMTKHQEEADQEALIESGAEDSNSDTAEAVIDESTFVINEVSSNGQIELYNDSTKEIDISGYEVFVRGESVYTVPENTQIEVNSFYTIETGEDFANRINNVISFYDTDKKIVRAISFDDIADGQSYGLVTDGGIESGYMSSTIGSSNADATTSSVEDDLTFSVPSGFYDSAFNLTISAPENCKVYYTVDGTEPTTESTEYTGEINIYRPSGSSYVYAVSDGNGYTYNEDAPSNVDMGLVVKAIAVDGTGEIQYKKSAAYFIGFSKDINYIDLPVISIEVDPVDMFGFDSGIYVPGKAYYEGFIQGNSAQANYLKKWSAPIQMEYYEASKDKTFATSASITIFNDQHTKEAQKAFVIKTTDLYPEGTAIDDYLNDTSNALYLLSGAWDNSTKIRNYLVNGLLDDTDILQKDYTPCIVFINGEYWGLYTLATNYDSRYFEDELGIKDRVLTVTSDYGVPQEYSEFYEYVVSTDFSVDENYQQVQTMMDVDNYIEFMCANIYMGNTLMWRNEAACVWRTVDGNGSGYSDNRWRWALNNVDNTLGNTQSFIDPYNRGDYAEPIINTYLSNGIKNNAFFNSLLQSDDFCKQYLETMDTLIANNFTQEHADEILADLSSSISKAVNATNKRFAISDGDVFGAEVKRLGKFFDERTSYITKYTEEYIGLKGDVPGKLSGNEESNAEGFDVMDESDTIQTDTDITGEEPAEEEDADESAEAGSN